MARVMAIDFGQKRVGLAITDSEQIIATALDTVPTKEVLVYLTNYFLKEQVSTLVVGYPVNHGHRDNPVLKAVDGFIAELAKKFPDKKIVKVDERFTSRIAMQTMAMSGLSRTDKHNKAKLDKISATIILQTFLGMGKTPDRRN